MITLCLSVCLSTHLAVFLHHTPFRSFPSQNFSTLDSWRRFRWLVSLLYPDLLQATEIHEHPVVRDDCLLDLVSFIFLLVLHSFNIVISFQRKSRSLLVTSGSTIELTLVPMSSIKGKHTHYSLCTCLKSRLPVMNLPILNVFYGLSLFILVAEK